MSEPLKTIAILGDNEHSWTVAAALVVGLKGQDVDIHVLSSDRDNHAQEGACEQTKILSLNTNVHAFHQALGIAEAALIKRVPTSYVYGLSLSHSDPTLRCEPFVYSKIGQMLERVNFHHYLARLKHLGGQPNLRSYSLAHSAADRGLFSHAKADSALNGLEYSINVDKSGYLKTLKAAVLQAGVRFANARLQTVTRNDRGEVRQLCSDSSVLKNVDFVIDCAGAIQNSSRKTLTAFDSQITISRAVTGPTPLLNQLMTGDGWYLKTVSLPKQDQHQFVYSSGSLTPSGAEATLAKQVPNISLDACLHVKQRHGYCELPWQGNVLSLGECHINLGTPLFSSLFHTQTAIQRWLSLYPRKECNQTQVWEFNRRSVTECQHVSDVHHLLLGELDSSETLSHRVELFAETGRVAFYESDVLESQQWVNLFLAMGIWPTRSDPLLNKLAVAELEQILQNESAKIDEAVTQLPKHDALLHAIRTR